MNARTIIVLSPPQCGSTFLYTIFKQHPDVYSLFEPHFWNSAADAINGDSSLFLKRMSRTFPFLDIPTPITESVIFLLWDRILKKYGTIVFDNTPLYLGNRTALEFIKKYKEAGNDVRLFALVRDPRDAITSQYIMRDATRLNTSLKKAEERCIDRYKHLEEIQNELPFMPVFRYEDVQQYPRDHIPKILHYCGLNDLPCIYTSIRSVWTGTYATSVNLNIRSWHMSYALKKYIVKFKYHTQKRKPLTTILAFLSFLPSNIGWEVYRILKRRKRIRKKERLNKFHYSL